MYFFIKWSGMAESSWTRVHLSHVSAVCWNSLIMSTTQHIWLRAGNSLYFFIKWSGMAESSWTCVHLSHVSAVCWNSLIMSTTRRDQSPPQLLEIMPSHSARTHCLMSTGFPACTLHCCQRRSARSNYVAVSAVFQYEYKLPASSPSNTVTSLQQNGTREIHQIAKTRPSSPFHGF